MEQSSFQLGTGEAASKAAPGQHPGQTAPAPLLDAPQMHWIITCGERRHFHPCKSSFTYVFLNSIPVHLQVLQISTLICNSSASPNGATSNQSSQLYFQHAQDLLSRVPKKVKCKWGPVHLALPTLGVSQKLPMANTTVGFRPSTQPAVGQLSSPPPQKKKKNKPSLPSCLAQWLHLLSSPALQHRYITYLTQTWAVFSKCLQQSEGVGSVHSASTSRMAPCSYTALVPFLQHVPPLWPQPVEQRSGYPRLQFT